MQNNDLLLFNVYHSDKSSCNILQTVFDPDNAGNGKAIGDIDARLGKIKVAVNHRNEYKTVYKDSKLSLLPSTDLLGPHRQLYLVIFHPKHDDSILHCSKINHRKPILAK